MKITMMQGGAKCALSNHGMEAPSGLVIDESGATQVAEFVRASASQPIDRGNRRTTIAFAVARQHADHSAAQRFLVDHVAEMVWDGVLVLEFQGLVGGRTERYLPSAVVESVRGNHLGATTFHQYQIIGAILQIKKPT